MIEEFPRVLVVTGNNFNLVTGGGITLTNLFRGWPQDRIANLHADLTPEDYEVCQRFYRLTDEEIRWCWPFSLAQVWYTRPMLTGRGAREGTASRGFSQPVRRATNSAWLRLTKRLLGDTVPKYAVSTDKLMRWVQDFRPTLLYGFLGSLEQMQLTKMLARTLSLPLVIHMMDDWPAVLYTRGVLRLLFRRAVQVGLQNVLRTASLRLGICEEMCEEYRHRYGCPFQPFQNALDLDQWLPEARQDWKAGSPFLVRYVGSIVADGQRQSLKEICDAVSQIWSVDQSIELRIHSPSHETAYLLDCGFPAGAVCIDEPPGTRVIASLLAKADLLVLPYNFDARSARYIRLSFPTKAPAYMASGTPVLIYGPEGIAIAQYAQRDGWAHVLSTQGIEPLKRALHWLMGDQDVRERIGRRAQAVARARHDASRIRPAFWAALAEASRPQGLDRWTGSA